jgi:hypothetical protein
VQLFGSDIKVDVSCFIDDAPSLESLSLWGSYVTTPESLDKLVKARPELGVSVRRSE